MLDPLGAPAQTSIRWRELRRGCSSISQRPAAGAAQQSTPGSERSGRFWRIHRHHPRGDAGLRGRCRPGTCRCRQQVFRSVAGPAQGPAALVSADILSRPGGRGSAPTTGRRLRRCCTAVRLAAPQPTRAHRPNDTMRAGRIFGTAVRRRASPSVLKVLFEIGKPALVNPSAVCFRVSRVSGSWTCIVYHPLCAQARGCDGVVS